MSFPVFKKPIRPRLEFKGLIGERILANQDHWLLLAPSTNPGMLNMFCDRNNNQDLLDFSGEFAGKYLISAVQYLRITQDTQLKRTIKQFVEKLIQCQDHNGYIGPFSGADRMHKWDLWGQYHCMLGLYLYYQETSDEEALKACCRAANLFCNTYIDTGKRVYFAACDDPPSTYCWPEVNEACIHIFTLLFQETNSLINQFRATYWRMIREIERDWTRKGGFPGGNSGNYVDFFQDEKMFYECDTRRWEALHDVQAIVELYFIIGDERYRTAFQNIWKSILTTDRHNTGGFCSGEEATGNPYDPRSIETCATIAWMAVNVDMLRLSGDPRAADELELSTWNSVLGSQNPDGSWWTYDTPMGGIPSDGMDKIPAAPPKDGVPPILGERRPSTIDLWWQAREGTPQLSCCAANGPRGLGFLSEWAVMFANDGIVLNYYGPSIFEVKTASGNIIKLKQTTTYPKRGKISLLITPSSEESFLLRLRIPRWSKNTEVSINGEQQQQPIQPGTYLLVSRLWKPGDKIDILLDMSPHFWVGSPPPQNSIGEGSAEGRVSVYHGPLLLAYDSHFDLHAANQLPFIDLTSDPREIVSPHASTVDPLILLQFDTLNQSTITLCDFASAGANGMPYVSWLPVIDKAWQFGRLDGTVIAQSLRLLSDGKILGSNNDNEFRWGLEGDTLVFFHRDNGPSTRFNLVSTVNGRLVLKGEFLFDRRITHVLTEMDWGITNKVWQFRRLDGTKIAESIRLLADGRILGPDGKLLGDTHENEFRWGLEGDTLVFFHRDNGPSTRFNLVGTVNDKFEDAEPRFPFNGLLLQGQFLFDPNITHLLIEIGPSWGSPEHNIKEVPAEQQIQRYREFKHSLTN